LSTIGFDIDGVIAKGILRSDLLLRYHLRGWNKLLFNPLGKFLYKRFRLVDKEVRKVIYQLKTQGHKIIIATYAFLATEEMVKGWLEENKIPYDKLFLSQPGETPWEFKIRIILQEQCDYFIEDQPALVKEISKRVKAKVIYYRDKKDLLPIIKEGR